MKKLLFVATLSTLGLVSAAEASGCNSPYCQGGGFFGSRGGHGLPAFQAAPWYLYWPYNNHFMTPAPMQGAGYYGGYGHPGGGLTNPYFPGGGAPAGGTSYPSQMPGSYSVPGVTPTQPMPGTTVPPNPMPQPTNPPTGTIPPVTRPPAGVTPPITPGVSIPVIPAVPGVIRSSVR